MTDLFITTLKQPLQSWSLAFSTLHCSPVLPSHFASHDDIHSSSSAVIWLHWQSQLQAQSQAWLKNRIEDIQLQYPLSRVVVLADSPKSNDGIFALGLGAGAYVHDRINSQTLQSIKSVLLHGGVWLGNDLLKCLIDPSVVHDDIDVTVEDRLDALTKREKEVAIATSKGMSNKEIARALNITERTVKAHLSAVCETLNVKGRLNLALVLHEQQRNQAFASSVALQSQSTKRHFQSIEHGAYSIQP